MVCFEVRLHQEHTLLCTERHLFTARTLHTSFARMALAQQYMTSLTLLTLGSRLIKKNV
jgi:hypothetical protein